MKKAFAALFFCLVVTLTAFAQSGSSTGTDSNLYRPTATPPNPPCPFSRLFMNLSGQMSLVSCTGTVTVIGSGGGGGGTVTSVGLSLPGGIFSVSGSPVTVSGTLSATLANQSANVVFAGPSTGSPAAPTFRSLVSGDIPNLDASKITTGQFSINRLSGVDDVINAKLDYGCVGNDVADDTTCLTNAIAAAKASGKVLKIPAGTYKTTAKIAVPGPVVVRGAGRENTIIHGTGNDVILDVTVGTGGFIFTGPEIHDLGIRGSGAGANQIGVRVDDATYMYGVTIEGMTITSTYSHGFYAGNVFSSTFKKITSGTSTVGYPFLINSEQMPDNHYEELYAGDVNTTSPAGYRIRRGLFFCYTCNGINVSGANSWWAIIGDKVGVDGSLVNRAAYMNCTNCNIESSKAGGLLHYYNSRTDLSGFGQFAGDGSASGTYIAAKYEVDTAIFPNSFQKGVFGEGVVFANSPLSYYANSQPIQANDIPPVVIIGNGPQAAGNGPVLTYYNTTSARAEKLYRHDARVPITTITANTTFTNPGAENIEANCASNCSAVLPWPGWYANGEKPVFVRNVGAGTLTITAGSGGTMNGSGSYSLVAGESVLFMPNSAAIDYRLMGGLNGSGAANRIPVFDTVQHTISSANFTYDGTTLSVTKAGGNPYLQINDTTNNITSRIGPLAAAPDRFIAGTISNHPFGLYANNGERFTITGTVNTSQVQLRTVGSSTDAPLRIGSVGGDPSSPSNGDIVYNSSTNKFRCYENGAWTNCITAGGGGGSTVWSDLTNPVAGLSLSMGANATAFTWNAATGAANLFSLADTNANTGTGYVLSVNTETTSAAKPARITARGTLNGVEMTVTGVLQPLGTGQILATPGGTTNSCQYNNGGGLIDGASNCLFDPSSSRLTLGTVSSQSGTVALRNSSNANLTILTPAAPASTANITFPAVSGTLATIAGTEALTGKTVNGLTITTTTGTLTIANGKTATVSNTLTFTGTDGSSVAFGAGGTVTYTTNNLSVFAATTSAQLAGVLSDETGTNLAVFNTNPTISGGTHTGLTSLGIRSTGTGAFDLTFANSENLTAGRTVTFTVNDAARTINLGGNFTLAAAFATSGANSLTLTTTGVTNVTLPTSGTLVNSAVTTLSSLVSIGTITTGVWNGTTIAVPNGGTGLTSGTSGGVLAFTASNVIASSGALTANMPVIGGGAGAVPTVGTVSGNTTKFVTTTGTITSGRCAEWDASGNLVQSSGACGVAGSGYATIQEEGSNLTARATLNFVGSAFTAADDAGNTRTNVTMDSDVNALASTSTTGLYVITGAGTSSTVSITAGLGISITNGSGVVGNPVVTVDQSTAWTWTALNTYQPSGTTPSDAISLTINSPGSLGTRDSHNIVLRGGSRDGGGAHTTDWKIFNDVTSNSGASSFTLASRIDAASYTTQFTVSDAGFATAVGFGGDGSLLTNLDAGNIANGTLPVARGGTGLTSATDDNLMVGSGSAWVATSIPNCTDTGGNHLNYNTTTNAFSCGTSSSGGGGSNPFDDGTAIIKGSADATKLLRFEVDGFTTATTRVITPPDANITLAGQDFANNFTVAQTITLSSANAQAIGPNGNTNPAFRVVTNVASAATGISVTGRAAGAGVDITAISSGTNENLNLVSKGTGAVTIPLGTAANPGIGFVGDATTGFFGNGSGRIGVSSAGTAIATFDLGGGNRTLNFGSGMRVGWDVNTGPSSGGNDVSIVRAQAGALRIAGQTTTAGSLILGTSAGAIGTSGLGVLAFTLSTAPSTSPTDTVQMYSQDAVAGAHELYTRNEAGKIERQTGLCRSITTQFDVTSSNTLATLTGLSNDVEAGRAYKFEANIPTTSGTSGGVKTAMSGTATMTSFWSETIIFDGGAITNQTRSNTLGTSAGTTAVSNALVTIRGTITVNAAGTFLVQFAQNASNGTTSSALVGGNFCLTPIS